MNKYLESLNRINHSQQLNKLEEYAKINGVPIIQYDSLMVLLTFIKIKKCKRILEIGTAIGYSALQMALLDDDIFIDTIERNNTMYEMAIENIKFYNKEKQINVYFEDALKISLDNLNNNYDLIFIDAAKSQYEKFFNRFSPLLSTDGIIITDNILFHGCVEQLINNQNQLTKNVRNMVKKIDIYNQNICHKEGFETVFISCGDGLAITMRTTK